jgi:hypothetical protein
MWFTKEKDLVKERSIHQFVKFLNFLLTNLSHFVFKEFGIDYQSQNEQLIISLLKLHSFGSQNLIDLLIYSITLVTFRGLSSPQRPLE